MKTNRIILLGLALTAFMISSAALSLEEADFEDRADRIEHSLNEAGIEEAYVNVSSSRVVVHYQQPPLKSDVDVYLAWIYIFSCSALNHPESEEIVIRQFYGDVYLAEASVPSSDVFSLMADEINSKEFGSRVSVKGPDGIDKSFDPCPGSELVGDRCSDGETSFLPEISFTGNILLVLVLLLFLLALLACFSGVVVLLVWRRRRKK